MSSAPDEATTGVAGERIGGGDATRVGLSAVYSACTSYVVLLIAAHTLSRADNAIFLAFWAMLFGVFGVLTGLNPEAARSAFVGASTGTRTPAQGLGPRLVPAALLLGGAFCLLLALSGAFWASRVLDADHAWLVVVVAVAGAAFSGHLALTGVLVGRSQWRAVVGATLLETSTRLVAVVVVVWWWRGSMGALAVAGALGAAAWLALLLRRDARAALEARADAGWGVLLRNYTQACVASASSSTLVVGFPILVRLTSDHREYLDAAGLLLAIALTRAPLIVPLNAFQGVALTHFLRHQHRGLRALLPIATGILLATGTAAALAGEIGPALFGLLLGDRYTVSGATLAGLTVAAGLLALLTMTGSCCLALGGHRAYAVGWVVSTVAAVLLLLVPTDLTSRTVLALVVAPVLGILVHVAATRSGPSGGRADEGAASW